MEGYGQKHDNGSVGKATDDWEQGRQKNDERVITQKRGNSKRFYLP